MKRFFWSVVLGGVLAASASAQFPGSTPIFPPQGAPGGGGSLPPNVMQNYFNRGAQPLSPYLNLLRGQGNLGIDYYFGVRPGLPSGGMGFNQQPARASMLGNSQMKQGYLPQAGYQTSEPLPLPDPNQDVVLPPSGHPILYGNVFGVSRTGVPGMSSTPGVRPGFFQPPTTGTTRR